MAEQNAAPNDDGAKDDRHRGEKRPTDSNRSSGRDNGASRGGDRRNDKRDDRRGPRRDDGRPRYRSGDSSSSGREGRAGGAPRRDGDRPYQKRDDRPRRESDRPQNKRGDDRPRRDQDRGRPEIKQRPEKPYRPGDAHTDDASRGSVYRPGEAARAERVPEPQVPEEITGKELDASILSELRTLSRETSDRVAKHLVAAGMLAEEGDLDAAQLHSAFAVRLGGRVGAVRETHGVITYNQGDYAAASREFRAARRITGRPELLPLIADCERGLGRPEKALQVAEERDVAQLSPDDGIELTIVVAGAYADMGDLETALRSLEVPALRRKVDGEWKVRLWVAYARLLERVDRAEEAQKWLRLAADADTHGVTDARESLGMPELAAADADIAWESTEEVGVVDAFEEHPEPAEPTTADPVAEMAADPEAVADGPAPTEAPRVDQNPTAPDTAT